MVRLGPVEEELVNLITLDLFPPTATLPKSRELVLSDKLAGANEPVEDGLPPPQDSIAPMGKSARSKRQGKARSLERPSTTLSLCGKYIEPSREPEVTYEWPSCGWDSDDAYTFGTVTAMGCLTLEFI